MKRIVLSFLVLSVILPNISFAALTPGSVIFANAIGKNTGQDNINFFWNDTLNYLGIGTSTPDSRLHVIGDAHVSGAIKPSSLLFTGSPTYKIAPQDSASAGTIFVSPSVDALSAFEVKVADGSKSVFSVDTLNRRIGVGLVNPQYEFQVANDGQNVEMVIDTYSTSPTFTTKTVFGGRAARGTREVPLPVQNNDILAEFSGLGYGTTAFAPSTTAGMRVIAAETFSDTAWGTGLFFRTTGRGSNILQTRMVVDADGNVGIGDTTPETPLDVEKLSITTDVATFSNINGTCSINPGVAGGITCTSDVNMKKDIENIEDSSSLEIVNSLRPVKYNWKKDAVGAEKTSGFIAQEVESVLPELVVTENGTKRLSMNGLMPYVVGSVKELSGKVNTIFTSGLKTPKIETEMLCIGETCIKEEDLKEFLEYKNR